MVLALCFAAAPLPAAQRPRGPPLGHRDFYPSPERPVGWRGDGTAAFPGATPVEQWQEGAVEQVTLSRVILGKEKKQRFTVFKDAQKDNIVWKRELPGFSNSQPIVVGDRVVATADPSFPLCLDAATGKVLWGDDLNPFEVQGLPAQQVEKLTALSDMAYCIHGITASLVGNYSRLGCHRPETMTKAHLRARLTAIGGLLGRSAALGLDLGVSQSQAKLGEALKLVEALPAEDAAVGEDAAGGLSRAVAGLGEPIRGALRKSHGVLPYTHWDGWTGFTWPAPVNDGRHVFVSMGQGQVARYDLAGRRIWARHLPYAPRGGLCKLTESTSPLLLGDVLVVAKYQCLAGLNKRTGEVLWQVEENDPQGGQSHAAVTVGGQRLFVSTHGKVIRPADGKVLCELGRREIVGLSMIGWDDVVYFANSGGGSGDGEGLPVAIRLVGDGPDKVKGQALWRRDDEAFGVHGRRASEIYCDGRLYRGNRKDAAVVDARTGSTLAGKLAGFAAGEGPAPILAGRRLIGTPGGGCPYFDGSPRYFRDSGGVVQEWNVVTLSGPAEGKAAPPSYLGGQNKARDRRLEKYLPELYRQGLWSTSGATPIAWGFGSPFAQGNRVFLLSASHAYCLGEPNVPYDWNTASRDNAAVPTRN